GPHLSSAGQKLVPLLAQRAYQRVGPTRFQDRRELGPAARELADSAVKEHVDRFPLSADKTHEVVERNGLAVGLNHAGLYELGAWRLLDRLQDFEPLAGELVESTRVGCDHHAREGVDNVRLLCGGHAVPARANSDSRH